MHKFREGNLCKFFRIFHLTNYEGLWYNKIRRPRTVGAAVKKKSKRFYSLTLFAYLSEDELFLKKPPTKDKSTTMPKACQKVRAKVTLNRLSTQLIINIPIQLSKHAKPKSKAITKITVNSVAIGYSLLVMFLL